MVTPAHWAIKCSEKSTSPWIPYEWLRLLNRELVELAQARADYIRQGHTTRNRFLIVEAPVRHGKSNLGSIYFPSWWLGTFKDDQVIQTGHTATLANTFAEGARDALKEYGQECFGVSIRGGSSAKNQWSLTRPHKGRLIAVGVGAPPAGRGGHLIVIDDPIKSSKEARSKTYQQMLRDWWQFDIRNRLEPGGVIVIIMSRWNVNDLVGWLKKREAEYDEANGGEDDGGNPIDRFRVLHLPALCDSDDDPMGRKRGQALCPERYPERDLLALRNGPQGVGPIAFDALYQNNPRPPEGEAMDVEKLRVLDAIPRDASIQWRRTFDLASTEEETASSDPDWTATCLMGRTPAGHTIIAEIDRIRAGPDRVESWVRAKCEQDWAMFAKPVPVYLPQDPGQAGKSQVANYKRNVLYGMVVDTFPESGDKVTRNQPLAGQIGAGNVYIVRAKWNKDFIEEARDFPNGDHDDQVDAASNAFGILAGFLKKRAKLVN